MLLKRTQGYVYGSIILIHLKLKNGEVERELAVSWNGTHLEHCPKPVYLGVTLDLTLSFKDHVLKTKAKVNTRNNVLNKLVNTKWSAKLQTPRPYDRWLWHSVINSAAEYACPVWERSKHAYKMDSVLNTACRCITGCLNSTNFDDLYLLAGIAPRSI